MLLSSAPVCWRSFTPLKKSSRATPGPGEAASWERTTTASSFIWPDDYSWSKLTDSLRQIRVNRASWAMGAMTLFFFFFRCSYAPRRPPGAPRGGEGRCDAAGCRGSRFSARATATRPTSRARAGPRSASRRSPRVRGRTRARARPGRVPGDPLDPPRLAARQKKKVKKKGLKPEESKLD